MFSVSDLKHLPLCDLPDPWQHQCSGARHSRVDVVTRVNGNQLGHVSSRSQGPCHLLSPRHQPPVSPPRSLPRDTRDIS